MTKTEIENRIDDLKDMRTRLYRFLHEILGTDCHDTITNFTNRIAIVNDEIAGLEQDLEDGDYD